MGKSVSNPIGAVTNMATGGMVGYSDGKFGRGAVLDAANKASGGELSKIGNSIMDTAFGSKIPGTPDSVVDLGSAQGRALQEQALGQYGNLMNQDYSQLAKNQINQQENQARQGVADQETRARQMVAQRGLGNTSMGMNAILGQSAGLNNQIGAIRAQEPALAQQMKLQNLNASSQGVNQIMNEQGQSKVLKLGQQAQGRSGGLVGAALPIAGQVLGGMAGAGAFN